MLEGAGLGTARPDSRSDCCGSGSRRGRSEPGPWSGAGANTQKGAAGAGSAAQRCWVSLSAGTRGQLRPSEPRWRRGVGWRELEAAPSAWDSELAKSANWKGKSHVASLELGVPPWSSDTRALRVASPCHTHSRFQPRRTAGSSAPLAERQLSFSVTALAEGPGSREHSISLADFFQSLPPSREMVAVLPGCPPGLS